jgi:methyl-accepting chemotaxis protein
MGAHHGLERRTARLKEETEMTKKPGVRVGLLAKIVLFLVLTLLPLGAIAWTISVRALRDNLTDEFTSKGTAIANSLATSAVDLVLTRDASTVQALVDQFAAIGGVAYVLVYDPEQNLMAHTYAPLVPPGLIAKNLVPGDVPRRVQQTEYGDPATGLPKHIIDIGVPVLGGQLGTVRVGMDRAIIDAAAVRAGWFLLATFGGVALLAIAAGIVFARRITRPLTNLIEVAQRVGRGDLSSTVRVSTRDEVGLLAETFNDTIVRLRSQVQTEAERDEERRTRQELQQNITRFLDTVVEISRGDLTRRGEVTNDVLGSVVDAINVMIEEIAAIVGAVRTAALHVAASSSHMIGAAGDMTSGAQAQTREAMSVTTAMESLTLSVRQVAASAEDSARAAQQALEAARKGDDAVRESLDGMQRIRREVQTISKRIKSLGDRSLEISAIVSTIEDIAGQTNLLALNATIEAAGAGEAGLRFAVVADEVRKLAERAARATKDIASLIKTVQAETQEAVLVTEHGTNEVESGYQITVQAGASLKEIATVAQRSAGLAQDISLATAEQARGTETVAASVQSISSVAVETEHGVLRTRKTIDELVKVAEELTSTLARFKLAA